MLPLPADTARFEAPPDWRAIDFLSDLHLSAATPRTFSAFAAHLERTTADAVFVLGDLFEAWIGDDMAEAGFERECADVLRRAAGRRRIGFMAGNRDFLVGDRWLERLGVMRLADPTLIVAWGERVVATHGDLLCLDDVAYQRFRRVVRRPWLQAGFRALPLAWRRRVGRTLRARGDRRPHAPMPAGLDVDGASARAWLDAAAAGTLLHGHTHAPAMHDLGAGRTRKVLSDWSLDDPAHGPPRADVLRWTRDGIARIAPAGAG